MPKMRTHRATKKRLEITGTGLVMRGRPGNSHLASAKNQKRIRHLRKKSRVSAADMKRLKKQVANFR